MEKTPLSVLLKEKGSDVLTINRQDTVYQAVTKMREHRVASLLIVENNQPVGIFTERDVAFKIACEKRSIENTLVEEVMSINLTTVTPETFVHQALEIVTNSRIRHLPVMEDGKLAGLISIGDLSRWLMLEQKRHIDHLTDYINS